MGEFILFNRCYSEGGGGWTATDDDDNPHLSLTFTTAMHVTSVVTQGHESRDEWVEKYTVSYRLVHEDNYQWVRDDDGNIIVSTSLVICSVIIIFFVGV